MSDVVGRRWAIPTVTLVATVVCAVAAAIAWTDAHVSYALPNSTGHDVLGGGIAAAVVCAVGALCSLGAVLFALRSPRSARACLIVAVAALVISIGALTLFEVGPSKAY